MIDENDISECRRDLLRLGLFDEGSVDKIVTSAVQIATSISTDPSPLSLSNAVCAILAIGWNGADNISDVMDKAMKELTGAV